MQHLFRACVFALALFVTAPVAAQSSSQPTLPPRFTAQSKIALAPREIFAGLSESVGTLQVSTPQGRKQGSGVIIGHLFSADDMEVHPLMVTNAHVVDAGSDIGVKVAGQQTSASIVYLYANIDLAFIYLPKIKGARRVSFASKTTVVVGDPVFAIGSPRGLENTLSNGLISSIRKLKDITLFQTSAPISPGSSGGGLFNERGQLVGITSSKIKDGENLNFAIEAEAVYDIYQSLRSTQLLIVYMITANTPERERFAILQKKLDVVSWLRTARDPMTQRPMHAVVFEETSQFPGDLAHATRYLSGLLDRIEREAASK